MRAIEGAEQSESWFNEAGRRRLRVSQTVATTVQLGCDYGYLFFSFTFIYLFIVHKSSGVVAKIMAQEIENTVFNFQFGLAFFVDVF